MRREFVVAAKRDLVEVTSGLQNIIEVKNPSPMISRLSGLKPD
jgi:hypothetical protein